MVTRRTRRGGNGHRAVTIVDVDEEDKRRIPAQQDQRKKSGRPIGKHRQPENVRSVPR
jgi:hypothetical protein